MLNNIHLSNLFVLGILYCLVIFRFLAGLFVHNEEENLYLCVTSIILTQMVNYKETRKIIKKNVALQPNISDMPFDQKSPRPPEGGVLNCHRQTDRQTDRRASHRRTWRLYD